MKIRRYSPLRRRPDHYMIDRLLVAARDDPSHWWTYEEDADVTTSRLFAAMARTGIRVETRRMADGRAMVRAIDHEIRTGVPGELTPVPLDGPDIPVPRCASIKFIVEQVAASKLPVLLPNTGAQFAWRVKKEGQRHGVSIVIITEGTKRYAITRAALRKLLVTHGEVGPGDDADRMMDDIDSQLEDEGK